MNFTDAGEFNAAHVTTEEERNALADRLQAEFTPEQLNKLRNTGHAHTIAAIREGIALVRNGIMTENDFYRTVGEAHERDHETSENTEDPGYYFGAGDAWKVFNKPKPEADQESSIPGIIGDAIREIFGDQLESVTVIETTDTPEPTLTANEVMLVNSAVMAIAAMYARNYGDQEMVRKAFSAARLGLSTALMVEGAQTSTDAVQLLTKLGHKLNGVTENIITGKTLGLFEAPF